MSAILIVDDEENLLPLLKKILQKEGYEVECVSSAEAALTQLRIRTFDLVISDLNMSGMNGLDLLKEAKTVNPALRFIILTGFGNAGFGMTAIKNGAHHYLTKPIDNEELKAVVKEALQLSRPTYAERVRAPESGPLQPSAGVGTVAQPLHPSTRKPAGLIQRLLLFLSKLLHRHL